MTKSENEKQSVDNTLYNTVKDMAIRFDFKPNERINEVELAQRLGVSRTPLRESLNRIVAEGFLVKKKGRGFFCRDLKPREMFELYQFRSVLEVAAVRLACEQATEQEVAELIRYLDETGPNEGGRSSEELVELDEYFHMKIMQLSRNVEMAKVLENINAKIRFFRWVDMDSKRESTQLEHRKIAQYLMARDADLAAQHMNTHITQRIDQITAAIKESYSRIYLVT